jgi:hypothetical protein
MQKIDSRILILFIVLAIIVDTNITPETVLDALPVIGNLDEGLLTVLATFSGQELARRRNA